ncbi:MAG: septal ring lytic transglycosylase RlpA family protein [Bacteroidota bacterium]
MKNHLIACTLLLASLTLPAQTVTWYGQGETGRQKSEEVAYTGPQTGFATFYAAYLAGQPTAYGETYQPTEMTASHANLPMGTLLKVTRLDNGAQITVRVNDRGGLCNGCVIVLSNRAAQAINLIQTGRSQVRIEKVGFSNWNPQPPAMQTNNPQMVTRSVEDRRMSWENELRNQPTPSDDPTAYQPATYGGTATVRPTSTTSYPQQPTMQTYPAPAAPSSATVRPVRQATTVNRPIPTTNQQEVAVMSPTAQARNPLADREIQPGSLNNASYSGTPTNNRAYVNRQQQQDPVAPTTYYPATSTPPAASPERVNYTLEPTTTGELTNRVIVAPQEELPYTIQVGAYGNRTNADRMAGNLRRLGLSNVEVKPVSRADGTVINRVLVGRYADSVSARVFAQELQSTYSISAVPTLL